MRAALRVPGFRRLTLVWAVINLADSTLFLTLAIWVKDLTGSDSAAGLVLAALAVPALFAPLTGSLADRVSRRRLVTAAGLVAAATVLTLLGVRGPGQLWLIYLVTVGYASIGYLVSAAQSGLLKDMLPAEDLAAANGLLTTIDQGLRLVTPLIGAGIYVLAGMDAVVVLTAALFALAAAGMTTVRLDETPPTPADERARFWREATAGFRHLRHTAPLGRLTVALAIAIGATGITNTTNFAAIEHGLGAGPELLGILASVQGFGAIAGGLAAAALVARLGEQTTAAIGLALLALGIATTVGTSLVLFCAGLVAAGIGVSLAVVAFVTMRQRLTPATLQGRVSAASNMACNVPQMTATLVAAAVILALDYRVMIAVTVSAVLAAAAICLPRAARVHSGRAAPVTVTMIRRRSSRST
jgi:MFS family permease